LIITPLLIITPQAGVSVSRPLLMMTPENELMITPIAELMMTPLSIVSVVVSVHGSVGWSPIELLMMTPAFAAVAPAANAIVSVRLAIILWTEFIFSSVSVRYSYYLDLFR
jgi:hypothetical protein